MKRYDFLIVGAGFAGGVCPRQLADAGNRVLLINKREHIAGNTYDFVTVGRGVVYCDVAASVYSGGQQTVYALLGVV